jgi:hypothetical protein
MIKERTERRKSKRRETGKEQKYERENPKNRKRGWGRKRYNKNKNYFDEFRVTV